MKKLAYQVEDLYPFKPICEARKKEYNYFQQQVERKIVGTLNTEYHPEYTLEYERGDVNRVIKNHSIDEAIRLILRKNIVLPEITFKLASSIEIQNQTCSAGDECKRVAIIYLGGKYWSGGKAVGSQSVISDAYDRARAKKKQEAQGTAIVIHEIGHLLHEINAENLFWSNKFRPKKGEKYTPGPDVWGDAAQLVSRYSWEGKETCLEFVAETFARGILGKPYKKKGDRNIVEEAYTECGGPAVDQLWK